MKQIRSRRDGLARALLLALAGAPSLAAAQAAASPQPAAPGDRLIVRLHEGVAPSAAAATVRQAMLRTGMTPRTRAASVAPARLRQLGNGAELLRLPDSLDDAALQRLADEVAADPRVRYAVPDRLRQPQQVEPVRADDPFFPLQWNLHDPVGGANVPAAWSHARGDGVVVAVVDTGHLPGHPDFDAARVLPGYDFVSEPFMSRRAAAGRAPGGVDQGDWRSEVGECFPGSPVQDSTWHGTHVAGTIAEATGNGLGMAGIAHQATLLPVRVLGRCGGYDSDIIDGLTWASGGAVEGVPANEHPADVINMSLGGRGICPVATQEAIDAAVARGSLVVVAAGNQTTDARLITPASCANVVTVAATGVGGTIANYSNYGPRIDLAAPGGGGDADGPTRGWIWQASHTGKTSVASGEYLYKPQVGTSMASPHVAAVAALVQSARVAAGRLPLAPGRLAWLLRATARPFPVAPAPRRGMGAGILDAGAAVRLAIDPSCDAGVADCARPAPLLASRVPLSGQDGDMAGRQYRYVAEPGRRLSIIAHGGTGNVSLYVRHEAEASASAYDLRSARPGNSETVRIAAPKAGTYHITLAGDPAFTGVTLQVLQ